MKKYIYLFILIPFFCLQAQKIGEFAEEKPHAKFPNNTLGFDLMIGEGGFGLGGFYRYNYTKRFTGFVDFSISESKHEREIQRYDYFGHSLPIIGKKNRVFLLPLNFGIQYRLFYESLTDNFRPYVSGGIGPAVFVTTPAQEEFFKSFGNAKAQFGTGGYLGFGANFGINSANLTGINIRYYVLQLFNNGIEQYTGDFKKTLHHITLTINIGFMY